MSKPVYWDEAKTHLMRVCPAMRTIIPRYGDASLMRSHESGFITLVRAVVGQQISVKAADAMWARLEKAVNPMTPENLLRKRETTLRKCGLSGQKAAYVRNIAQFYKEHPFALKNWKKYSDDEVIALLTGIKGIGKWTAEMFLMFHLHRPDIFPVQDIGVLKAMHLHCSDIPLIKNGKYHHKSLYEQSAKLWMPYRTVASWYLWRSLDPVPVEY